MTTSKKAAASNAPAPKANAAKRNRTLKTAVPAIFLAREKLLKALGDADRRTKGLYEAYAVCLNKAFGKGWTKLVFSGRVLSDKEKQLAGQIRAQKAAFIEGANKRGVRNPYSAWNNVKAWCDGETATQKKGANGAHASAPRPLGQAQREIGSTLYARGLRAEDASEAELNFNVALGKALRDFHKVDLSTLVK